MIFMPFYPIMHSDLFNTKCRIGIRPSLISFFNTVFPKSMKQNLSLTRSKKSRLKKTKKKESLKVSINEKKIEYYVLTHHKVKS
jgi:hypothetical protein